MQDNCERCMIIKFPFDKIESAAPHIRSLPNFAWKPIVVHVNSSISMKFRFFEIFSSGCCSTFWYSYLR